MGQIDYCRDTVVGILVTYDDGMPDMAACIERFQRFDPDVREIWVETLEDGQRRRFCVYQRCGGDWRCLLTPQPTPQTR